METNMLLDTYLKELRLSTFLQNYRKFAEDAAQANHSYDHFLLALAEQEVAQRERNRIARRIKGARFPVLKELADFDFSCISSPNKQRVLKLAQGSYIQKAEPILLVGNPGLGKTHIATGLALAALYCPYRTVPVGEGTESASTTLPAWSTSWPWPRMSTSYPSSWLQR